MRNNKASGFTLIEILVVLLIIGITLGFALLAFGDFGQQRRIRISAEQFINYIKFAQQQAILESNTLGVRLTQNSYQLFRFQAPSSWQPMPPQKNVFKEHYFPRHTLVQLQEKSKVGTPQIMIAPTGDVTPFKLLLISEKQEKELYIIGESNGKIFIELMAAHE